ncbi:MAG: hypothetical protein IPJ62_14755 [Betaproteobacteria bacterium]|nr:hypothetical protein [Betaproteobacteria bacterium]
MPGDDPYAAAIRRNLDRSVRIVADAGLGLLQAEAGPRLTRNLAADLRAAAASTRCALTRAGMRLPGAAPDRSSRYRHVTSGVLSYRE